MLNLITLKRNKAQESINFNPTTITFTRKETILNSITGSLDMIESEYTETIRITKQNNLAISINQDLGVNYKKSGYVLLGNYESNMKCNNNITDFFYYNDELYKITSTMVNIEKTEVTSIQAIAEVVNKW